MKSFSWVIAAATFCNVYSMDSSYLKALTYIVGAQNREDVIWELILHHGIKFFDYRMIKSLVVNHHFAEILRRTTEKRKIYLRQRTCRFDCHNTAQYKEWCVYGAVNGRINIEVKNTFTQRKEMTLQRDCLSNPMRAPYSYTEDNFYGSLPHDPQPFFNGHGDFCFYAHGKLLNAFNSESGAVFEYSLSADGVGKKIECMLLIFEGCFYALQTFLELPSLLKAILNSRQIYKRKIDDLDKEIKVFVLKEVMIPKDYALYRQYFSDPVNGCFNNLPNILRNKIIVLYKKQCMKEKRKNILF